MNSWGPDGKGTGTATYAEAMRGKRVGNRPQSYREKMEAIDPRTVRHTRTGGVTFSSTTKETIAIKAVVGEAGSPLRRSPPRPLRKVTGS
jgi:hypothetical protein